MLAITDANTPIFDQRGDPTKSCITHLKEEFIRRFPVTNRRTDFFLQSQGTQQFTAYLDKLRNMAVKTDLSNATAEDLIVDMGNVGCQNDELQISKSSKPQNSRTSSNLEKHSRGKHSQRWDSPSKSTLSSHLPKVQDPSNKRKPMIPSDARRSTG